MTDDEIAEFYERWKEAGEQVRLDWLAEVGLASKAAEWDDIRILLADEDQDVVEIMASSMQWHADAPRRNARKKRRKTQERGVSWQRELAIHLNTEGSRPRWDKYTRKRWDKYNCIPRDHDGMPLSICGGKFEITRRKGKSRIGTITNLIRCEFEDGRMPEEISFSTFERYLKENRGD